MYSDVLYRYQWLCGQRRRSWAACGVVAAFAEGRRGARWSEERLYPFWLLQWITHFRRRTTVNTKLSARCVKYSPLLGRKRVGLIQRTAALSLGYPLMGSGECFIQNICELTRRPYPYLRLIHRIFTYHQPNDERNKSLHLTSEHELLQSLHPAFRTSGTSREAANANVVA